MVVVAVAVGVAVGVGVGVVVVVVVGVGVGVAVGVGVGVAVAVAVAVAMKPLSESAVLHELHRLVRRHGSQYKAAIALEVPQASVSMALAGKRRISPQLAKAMGYERVYAFIPSSTRNAKP